MQPGRDHVGVGVGAVVSDDRGRLFLARRGPAARNEVGTWEFPGGTVRFGEALEHAITREFDEEYGMVISITGLLGVFDHLLPGEHWVSITYTARHVSGEPSRREPTKCTEIGWFDRDSLPAPLSLVSHANARALGD
jgi:8-oxo-dGTP diphosphatase